MPEMKKLLLVGWDAADWKVAGPLMEAGLMPNLRRLVEHGVRGNLATLSPAFSPMLWTSIATGKRPHKHGIYGFTEPTPDRTAVQPVTNRSRRCRAIWNILHQQGHAANVVGWWPSHPAEPIRGAMVSDYYGKAPRRPGQRWELMPAAVHPPRLFETLRDLRFHPEELTPDMIRVFIPHADEVDQAHDTRLSICMKMIAECTTVHAAVTHLMEHEPAPFTAVYYDAIDHFSHGYMRYRAPQQSWVEDEEFRLYRHVVDAGYAYHDMMLGRLLELAGDDATVVVLSDHGFQSDHNRPTAIPSEPAGPAHEHREQGIFVACGPGIRRGGTVEGASLLDVTPTLLAILGLPVGADMDGRPLVEIFEAPPAVETIPSWDEIPGEDGSHPPDRTVDPAESKEALEQLIALGYIERPPDDTDRAIAETERELDYNLARAYMDAGMHGEAIPLLARLYRDFPLEFRFGVQLANCLLAMRRLDDLDRVVEDLNRRWRNAREAAKERLDAIAEVARERKAQWEELDRIDREHEGEAGRPRLARRTMQGRPLLFSDAENHVIRKLRAVARGNPMTLDYLAAVSASTRHRHDEALAILDRTRLRRAASPDLQFHVGMIELEAGRAEEARTHFERALEIEPEHASALLGLCRVELRADRPGAALGYGERSVALRPHVAGAWFFVGRARLGTGDVDGAIAAFRTGIELNPNFMEAHQELAHLLSREKGDDEQAATHRQASSDLALAAAQAKTAIAPIELPPLDEAAIAAALPELPEEHARAREGFLRCLGQAPGPVERADGASDEPIVVVSGLPRSGTSMMMQMMAAAGVPIVTDEERAADENNPKGYFEAESIKALPRRNDWVPASGGRCMKVVAPLVPYLPQGPRYRVIFMQRAIEEVLGSQDRMLERLDRSGAQLERDRLAEIYAQQVQFALDVLELHGAEVLRIDHADAIDDPAAVAAKVAAFLGGDRDARAMAAVVDPSLHRERAIDS